MKTTTILMLGMASLFFQACDQEKPESNEINKEVEVQTEVKVDSNSIVFENLDQILSPFEDMTEYALNKNDEGILKSLNKVEAASKENIFSKNLKEESIASLNSKMEILKELISKKDYEQIALASTELFEYNTSNFIDTKKIENQIHIEHLDYMGFKVLALLNQKQIDWKNIEQTISNVEKEWIALNPNVKDGNLKDSFELLFNGLHLSAQNKDAKMGEILASMDLSLVDVLENSF